MYRWRRDMIGGLLQLGQESHAMLDEGRQVRYCRRSKRGLRGGGNHRMILEGRVRYIVFRGSCMRKRGADHAGHRIFSDFFI